MKKALFFDTETTGKWDFKADATAPHQPSIVQIAALLFHGTEQVAQFSLIVKDGYGEIAQGAQDIHGISFEKAQEVGVSMATAYGMFANLVKLADEVVCHNYQFDSRLIAKTAYLLNKENVLDGKKSFCTMTPSPICAYVGIKNAYGKYKWPKLIELHQKLFNKGFDSAHDAMGDIIATKDCYFELLKRGVIN